MTSFLKRYSFFLLTILALCLLYILSESMGSKAILMTGYSFKEMLLVIPPVFVLLGLLDVWVSRETMMKYMGDGSGLKGILLSLLLGSAAAGPLYAAFPIAGVFMKKGVKFTNVLLFMGAWSTTKIPMLLFEFSALGIKFTLTRLAVSLCGIFVIAYLVDRLMTPEEIEEVYDRALQID